MAAGVSGSMSTNSSTYIVARVSYSETYDVASNTSSVTATLAYRRTNTYAYVTQSTGDFKVNINGTNYTVYSGLFQIPGNDNNWKTVGSKTVTGIAHNADGSKSITIGGSHTGNLNPKYLDFSKSETVALTTIPRASKPTYSSDPLTIGQTQTITTNRASSGFTHTLDIVVGGYTETIQNVGASTTWTPATATLMPYMDTWQKEVTVTCTTYNGTTKIGASTTSFKLQVDTSVYKPVITIGTLSDVGQATQGLTNGSFIKGKSTLQTSISVASNDTTYGDTVAQATATLGSTTDTEQGGTSALGFVFSAVTTTNVLTVTATDNRGYTVTQTVTLTLLDYADISILSVDYARVNVNNVETETGEYVRYTIKAYAFLGSFGAVTNTIAVTSKSKTASASVYGSSVSEQTVTTSGSGMGEITITGVTVGTYSPSAQYDIIFTLTDELSTATSLPMRVHEGVPVAAWGEDHFDVYGEFHVHDREDVTKYTTIYPDGYRWKLAGTASGTTAVNFDSTICSEIMLVAKYVENATYTWMTTATIPTDVLDSHGFFVMMGARISLATAQDKGCLIQVTDTYARINEWNDNRTSVASSGSLSVYYR